MAFLFSLLYLLGIHFGRYQNLPIWFSLQFVSSFFNMAFLYDSSFHFSLICEYIYINMSMLFNNWPWKIKIFLPYNYVLEEWIFIRLICFLFWWKCFIRCFTPFFYKIRICLIMNGLFSFLYRKHLTLNLFYLLVIFIYLRGKMTSFIWLISKFTFIMIRTWCYKISFTSFLINHPSPKIVYKP